MKGGTLIREARRRAGLTQKELAARLGTSQSVVARWESGRRDPAFGTVVRAIRACGLDLHPSIAVYDDQDDIQIAGSLRLTPSQRLAVNRNMLEVERWAQRARRVATDG